MRNAIERGLKVDICSIILDSTVHVVETVTNKFDKISCGRPL